MVHKYTYPPSRVGEDINTGKGWITDSRVRGNMGAGLDGDPTGDGGYWFLEYESHTVLDWGYVE